MTRHRGATFARSLLPLLAAALIATGCRSRPAPESVPAAGTAQVAHYRVRGEIEGRKRRFRLMLYAASPDAVHAEIVAPVGGTVLIVDGHERKMAVSFVRERTAYVGEASVDAGRYLLGFDLGASDLVEAVLSGNAPPGVAIERDGAPGDYPERLLLEADEARLELELRRLRPLPAGNELASGRPPDGFEVRPLSELRGVEAVPEMQAPQPGGG